MKIEYIVEWIEAHELQKRAFKTIKAQERFITDLLQSDLTVVSAYFQEVIE